jgi:hypothetical protein
MRRSRAFHPQRNPACPVPVPIHPEWRANYDLREEPTCYCCRISAGLPKEIEIRALLCPIVVYLFE